MSFSLAPATQVLLQEDLTENAPLGPSDRRRAVGAGRPGVAGPRLCTRSFDYSRSVRRSGLRGPAIPIAGRRATFSQRGLIDDQLSG